MSTRRDVEIQTIDGLVLRGWLYPTQSRGPGIVITPGFNCIKEMFVLDVAESLQKSGFNALVYDPRNLGESDGLPRNDIDPGKQMSDYSDALSYLAVQPSVDPTRLAFWGISLSATVALCAAAFDRRAKCCVAVCPLLNLELAPEKLPKVLARCMQDRSSQTIGRNPAMMLPIFTSDGRSPAGLGFQASETDMRYGIEPTSNGAPIFDNRTTMQTYYKLVAWKPHAIMQHLHTAPGTAIMLVIPENDTISPPCAQEALFDTLPEPKVRHVAPDKGHLDVLSGDGFITMMAAQASWLQDQMGLDAMQ